MAAENGHLAIVEALLEAGAKINCLIFDSCLTPLHLALSKVCVLLLMILDALVVAVFSAYVKQFLNFTHVVLFPLNWKVTLRKTFCNIIVKIIESYKFC